MTHYTLLLKKQLQDSLPSVKRGKIGGLMSTALMLVLIAGIIAAFALIFSKFTSTYTAIKINRVPDMAARQYELMSIAYFVLFVICVLSGVNRLVYAIFENTDLYVLISMPFSAMEIFLSKLTGVYIRQLALSLVFVLPVNLTFFITTHTVDAYNVLMSFAVAVVLPIIPLGIASVLALPYYYLKKLIGSHYLISFAALTLAMVAFCVLYSYVFRFAENLLNAGKLASLFNERVMGKIVNFTAYNYPANLFANIMLKRKIGESVGILLGIAVAAAGIGTLVIHAIFIRLTQSGFALHVPHVAHKTFRFAKKSRALSLLGKEFLIVLRTPGYAFMYFTTAIIMPVMVYYSASLASSLLGNLLGGLNADFEVCTFLVLLYGTLTNTFCSTNISRDGYMSMMQKTLPYSPAQILSVKMLFSGIVAELSIIAACVTLVATGFEQAGDGAVTFLSATMLALAQIALATRMDLNHPHFSKTDDGEIKEANSTVSAIIVIGLVAVLAIGALLLFNTVRSLISGTVQTTDRALSFVYALVIPLLLLGIAATYFFVGLKKVYSNLDAEA